VVAFLEGSVLGCNMAILLCELGFSEE